ncbi:hypothetical protein ABIB35_002669 [Arthrobacter sp. UYP6]|uniref:hypothetical protein n=1 Tax=Arthrobacter sp. UYP6 TaxID=1756378 RepID=UPI003398EF91
MVTLILLVGVAALLFLVIATVHAVSGDGRGHLPPVRSHPEWGETGTDQSGAGPGGRGEFSTLPYLP